MSVTTAGNVANEKTHDLYVLVEEVNSVFKPIRLNTAREQRKPVAEGSRARIRSQGFRSGCHNNQGAERSSLAHQR